MVYYRTAFLFGYYFFMMILLANESQRLIWEHHSPRRLLELYALAFFNLVIALTRDGSKKSFHQT